MTASLRLPPFLPAAQTRTGVCPRARRVGHPPDDGRFAPEPCSIWPAPPSTCSRFARTTRARARALVTASPGPRATGLRIVECSYQPWTGRTQGVPPATGNYVNFLRSRGIVVLPTYGIPQDEDAVRVVKKCFPAASVDRTPIGKPTGVGGWRSELREMGCLNQRTLTTYWLGELTTPPEGQVARSHAGFAGSYCPGGIPISGRPRSALFLAPPGFWNFGNAILTSRWGAGSAACWLRWRPPGAGRQLKPGP